MSVKYSLKEAAQIIDCDVQDLKYDIKDSKLQAERKKISGKRFEYIISQDELVRYAREMGISLVFKSSEINTASSAAAKQKAEKDKIKKKPSEIKKPSEDYEILKKINDKLKKELELANLDFNDQAEEYDQLLDDYEKLEEEKNKQDGLIAEAEQALLDMVEQYRELAEETHTRDKNISKLNQELNELKKNIKYELKPEVQRELEDYKHLKEDYELILLEKQRLHMEVQEKTRQVASIYNIHKEIEKLQNELKTSKEYINSLEKQVDSSKTKQEALKDLEQKHQEILLENEKLNVDLREKHPQLVSIRNIHREIEKLQFELKTAKEYISSLENQLDDSKKSAPPEEPKNYKKVQKKYQKTAQENEKLKNELEKEKEYIKLLKLQLETYEKTDDMLSPVISNPFPGDFSSYETLRLIRYLSDTRSLGKVTFQSPSVKGELHVKDGNIVHAIYNNWEGDLALAKFLNLKEGKFDFQPDVTLKTSNVNYPARELLEDFIQNKTEKINKLIEIADFLISPDSPLKIERNWLEADISIKLTKYHVKILSLVSQDKETVNKIAKELNSSQFKVAEAAEYLIRSGLISVKQ